MQHAIDHGLHVSALVPSTMAQLDLEIKEKVKQGQVHLVSWEFIKADLPTQLKISPFAMVLLRV